MAIRSLIWRPRNGSLTQNYLETWCVRVTDNIYVMHGRDTITFYKFENDNWFEAYMS